MPETQKRPIRAGAAYAKTLKTTKALRSLERRSQGRLKSARLAAQLRELRQGWEHFAQDMAMLGFEKPKTIDDLEIIARHVGMSRNEVKSAEWTIDDILEAAHTKIGTVMFEERVKAQMMARACPADLISMAVALKTFRVDRTTLLRAVKDEKIKSYRPDGAARTATHWFSERELASHYPRL